MTPTKPKKTYDSEWERYVRQQLEIKEEIILIDIIKLVFISLVKQLIITKVLEHLHALPSNDKASNKNLNTINFDE